MHGFHDSRVPGMLEKICKGVSFPLHSKVSIMAYAMDDYLKEGRKIYELEAASADPTADNHLSHSAKIFFSAKNLRDEFAMQHDLDRERSRLEHKEVPYFLVDVLFGEQEVSLLMRRKNILDAVVRDYWEYMQRLRHGLAVKEGLLSHELKHDHVSHAAINRRYVENAAYLRENPLSAGIAEYRSPEFMLRLAAAYLELVSAAAYHDDIPLVGKDAEMFMASLRDFTAACGGKEDAERVKRAIEMSSAFADIVHEKRAKHWEALAHEGDHLCRAMSGKVKEEKARKKA